MADLRKSGRRRPWKVKYRYILNGVEQTCSYLSKKNAERAAAEFKNGIVVRIWQELPK